MNILSIKGFMSVVALSVLSTFGFATDIKMTTTLGDIVIKLNHEKAPISAKNFQQYVEDGFYDGLIFHRVIPGFMAQGGGFTEDMSQKSPREAIANESMNGLKNNRGTLSMARTNAPHSATSQFFINVVDNAFLNAQGKWGYAVFAEVTSGMDVVDQIVSSKTKTKNGFNDVPVESVFIIKAEVMEPMAELATE